MTKIKIIGTLIFIFSIFLAIISHYIDKQNNINSSLLDTMNSQKAFTQEISKNIFYIYKNKDSSEKQLDESIEKFLENMNNRDERLKDISSHKTKKQSSKIVVLWNKFYLSVQKFRDQNKVVTAYSRILLEKTVKDIYSINLELIVEFDKLINMHKKHHNNTLINYKNIQYGLFFILVSLILYLFTQIKDVIIFVQKFLKISKGIITNSSIKQLKPIKIENSYSDIKDAADNFNFLVEKINKSIQHSTDSIEHTSKSLEQIEDNIEEFLELLSIMDESKEIDINLTKKEDAVIHSLEELMNSTTKLKNLKVDLENLLAK